MSTNDTPTDGYYTVAEVARIIRRTPSSVRDLCVTNKIPATKPAGTWLIPADAFREWLKAGENAALSA